MKGDIPLFDISSTSFSLSNPGHLAGEAEALGINVGAGRFLAGEGLAGNRLAGSGLIGPGVHREDEALSYLEMPKEMDTFEIPVLPEVEALSAHPEAAAVLTRLQQELDQFASGQLCADTDTRLLVLDQVPAAACALLYQILGEGEVALMLFADNADGDRLRVQETVLAGVWWVQQVNSQQQLVRQWLEVGAVPTVLISKAFPAVQTNTFVMGPRPDNLLNGASVMVELLAYASRHAENPLTQPHVVNLSLLPFSVEDQIWLNQRLGNGYAAILSRGYGNCRISSTAVSGIWRVQYFNSTDQLILDTLEVVTVPQVVCAAREDLEDSAERLREIHIALQA
jgi:hydrogenase-1 operon protein HyaF